MGQGHRALAERIIAAVFAEPESARPLIHPDFELVQARTLPYAGVYRGADGFFEFLGVLTGSYDVERMEILQIFGAPGGDLVVEVALRGRLKATGKLIDSSLLEKWEFEGGTLRRITPHYFDPLPRD